MKEFFTIPEAVVYSGTSDSTIRRLIKKIRNDPKSKYYELCQKRDTENGAQWIVGKALLDSEFNVTSHVTSHDYDKVDQVTSQMTSQKVSNGNHYDTDYTSQNQNVTSQESNVTSHDYDKIDQVTSHEPEKVTSQTDNNNPNDKLISFLEQQLAEKDKQISELLKRQSETNILLHNYQTNLLDSGTNSEQIISEEKEESGVKDQDQTKKPTAKKYVPKKKTKKKNTVSKTKRKPTRRKAKQKRAKKPVPKPPTPESKPKRRGLFGFFR